jgi:hypothetical protein
MSAKMAADYQAATTLLVTGAGESEKSIGMVRKGLLDMAPAVGFGPVALAKAMCLRRRPVPTPGVRQLIRLRPVA